jgi:hypothetical protein
MASGNVTLTAQEQTLLIRLLEAALGETRVELHHTHFSPEFRDSVKQEESLLRELLQKVRQAVS